MGMRARDLNDSWMSLAIDIAERRRVVGRKPRLALELAPRIRDFSQAARVVGERAGRPLSGPVTRAPDSRELTRALGARRRAHLGWQPANTMSGQKLASPGVSWRQFVLVVGWPN